MSEAIPRDATIREVLSTLKSPDAYVAGVFGKVNECRRAHGNAAVRIGVTGKGLMPYYRVIFDAEQGEPDINDRIFGAYFDNHTPLEWTTAESSNALWSSRFMTYDEVRALLAEIRHLPVPQ